MTSSQGNLNDWPYPGSRWWKFDFHTHTPASVDTYWARENVRLTPEDWLLRYMAADFDCIAITDHNSGAWIDPLKEAYGRMKEAAESGSPPDGFRELTLFPAVELSVAGGFHLLAIFDPSATTRTITDLLAQVGYRGTDGGSDGVTRLAPAETVCAVAAAGGIPIPAHADGPKGLLQLGNGQEPLLDANTIRDVLDAGEVLAVEWCGAATAKKPKIYDEHEAQWAHVLGSDCHSFQGNRVPGCAYTWIKMARPTLEGLRLALLDGEQFSVRRSNGGQFEPFRTPEYFLTRVEVDSARYMGMGGGEPAGVAFTPYYNALIGGRGTGKSSIVHALRLVCSREHELHELGENAEPTRQFASFAQVAKGRDSTGALRNETEMRVELMRDGVPHRVRWRADSGGHVVEERDSEGEWQASAGTPLE